MKLSRLHAGWPASGVDYARPRMVGVTVASWCGRCPGPPVPTARRGRRRPKAERADRQRRESLRARHARLPDRTAQFTTKATVRQRAQDDLRRQAHGALRAPLKTLEKVLTDRGTRQAVGTGCPPSGDARH